MNRTGTDLLANNTLTDVSAASFTDTNPQESRFHISHHQSHLMSVSNAGGDAMQVDDEEEQFDDTLDEVVSHVPDPTPSAPAQVPRTSSAIGDNSVISESLTFGLTPGLVNGQRRSQSSQRAFDAQVYRDLLNDTMFRISGISSMRRMVGLEETVTRVVTHNNIYDPEPDDESDDEFPFDD